MASKLKLFDSDDDDSELQNCNLTVNKEYADRYSSWKEKEELQKLKAKYGDLSSSSSSSSDDEEEMIWSPEADKDWLRIYSAVKFKDSNIYDKNYKFIDGKEEEGEENSENDSSDSEESESESSSKKKKKKDDGPMTIRDHERKVITERNGALSDSEDEQDIKAQIQGPSYHEEQEAIRKSIKKAVADMSSGDEDEDIISHRVKSDKEKEKEKEEYLQFLKGEKEAEDLASHSKQLATELMPLRSFYTQSEVTEADRYLWKTVLCKGAFSKKSENIEEDLDEDLSEDEQEQEDLEEFEQTYNFRYEEPDKNFVKQYKRNPEESLRQKVNKRAQKRKETQERKKMAMEEKREEIRRLKKLKQKELVSRLELLMKECPNGVDFAPEDLKGEFDPKAYDRMMKEKFDNVNEEDDGDDEKPDLGDLEDIMSIDSYEDIFEETEKSVADSSQQAEEDAGPSGIDAEEEEGQNSSKFNMDAGFDPLWMSEDDPSQSSRRSRRRRKKSKFRQALDTEKPLFSEVYEKYKKSDTPWEDYVQEYYNLDYKEHGFRYRKVVPSDYGMHSGEILWLPTRELNAWVSMKKVMEQRMESEELYDQRKYQSAKMQRKILNVMPSLKKIEEEEARYEDIRPSVLRQQKIVEQQADRQADSDTSEMSESEQPAQEDLGNNLQADSQSSRKKKKRKIDLSESVNEETPPRKKKKVKSSRQLLKDNQETEMMNQTERKKAGKKKKKKTNTGSDKAKAIKHSPYTEKKTQLTENRTDAQTREGKKKKKLRIEAQGNEAEDTHRMDAASENATEKGFSTATKKKKKKQKETKESSENPAEAETKKERKKRKKQKCEEDELQQTAQGGKKRLKGKKKQKKGDGTPKRKGYLPIEKIQESRLAAFHIDPRKFKYTKDRIVPVQPDQD